VESLTKKAPNKQVLETKMPEKQCSRMNEIRACNWDCLGVVIRTQAPFVGREVGSTNEACGIGCVNVSIRKLPHTSSNKDSN